MNWRIVIALVFIIVGGSDLILWVFNGFSFGWFEFIFGVNAIANILPWTLVATGIWLIRRERSLKKIELELITEISKGETVEYRQDTGQTLFIITNQKIIFRNYGLTKEFTEKYEDLLIDDKRNVVFNEIESARIVLKKEIALESKEKKSNKPFGIQLILKSGEKFNIDLGNKCEFAFAHLQKQMKD